MSRHVVIGTAGHVDHGKTALVRALTGIDTDRWEEEKRRGITIDLGFAHLDLGEGITASIVDVPGHEDFVRNMVAGATGIDLALLVVAADESVMPQTTEHVAILDFLAVRAGVVAIAKTDLVDRAWQELVESEVRERLAASRVAWRDVVPVSAVSGDGLESLKAALRAAANTVVERPADDLFRLPIDRAFSVAGAGTVVTGTVWSGTVRPGDEVTILPGGKTARVRSVQVHGHARPAAVPGRRTALALTGIERAAAPRGTVAVAGEGWRVTHTMDVVINLLPQAPAVSQRSRVRVHLGTGEVLARVTPALPIPPGSSGAARLRLEAPLVARWGDRAVLRSYSPVTTIGGCLVADPWPPARPRRPPDLQDLLAAEERRVATAVRRSGARGVGRDDLPVRLGIPPARVGEVIERMPRAGVHVVGDRLVGDTELASVRERIVARLGAAHREDPLAPGVALEEIRALAGDATLADHAVTQLVGAGTLALEGAFVRLLGHAPGLDEKTKALAERVRNALRAAGFEGMTAAELAGAVQDASTTGRVLEYFVRQNTVGRVGRDRYYDAETLASMVRAVADVLRERGEVGPGQLRERLGLTRKYLIPFLEWLDGRGYTVRVGDLRRPGPRLTND